MTRDPNVARTRGRGVCMETSWDMKAEETLIDVALEFGGFQRIDIDETYQWNFVTFQFDSIKTAREVVKECNRRYKSEYTTVCLRDLTYGDDLTMIEDELRERGYEV